MLRRACAILCLILPFVCWFLLCFAEIVKEMTNKTPHSYTLPQLYHFFWFFPFWLPVNGLMLAFVVVVVVAVAKSKLIFHLKNIPEMSFVHLFFDMLFCFSTRSSFTHCFIA